MASCQLSSRAEADLSEIADYTFSTFGMEQALQYGEDLEACFQRLADRPTIGTSAAELAPGLRQFEYRSHVIFYSPSDQGVFVVRVLHAAMDFRRHLG